MPKLSLYQIIDTAASGKDRSVPGALFSDKNKAKAARRVLNKVEDGKPEQLRYVVSPGPDHHNFKA